MNHTYSSIEQRERKRLNHSLFHCCNHWTAIAWRPSVDFHLVLSLLKLYNFRRKCHKITINFLGLLQICDESKISFYPNCESNSERHTFRMWECVDSRTLQWRLRERKLKYQTMIRTNKCIYALISWKFLLNPCITLFLLVAALLASHFLAQCSFTSSIQCNQIFRDYMLLGSR